MSSIIDLHTHSTASDGTDEPIQLVQAAKSAGIQIIALTDHDTVSGTKTLAEHPVEGITVFHGIEFSCRMVTGKCHILGYCCDTEHPDFQAALRESAALREGKLNLRLNFLRDRGITFPAEELDELHQIAGVGKPHLANLMVKYGYAPSRQEAIQNTINLCATRSSRISAETAVKAILASGGIPVWAHPLGGEGEKKVSWEQFHWMLDELTGYGLMGMECWYSRYTLDCCESLFEIAQERGLLISGGSDYHGMNKDIALGTLNAERKDIISSQITILDALLKR